MLRMHQRKLAVAVVLAAMAAAIVATAVSAAPKPTVKVAQTAGLGKLLTTSSGLTLYHYIDEKAGSGKIDCKGACAQLWPPLVISAGAKPTAGPGLTAAKLGTVKRPDGKVQVTYAGIPLYRYAPDKKAGDVKGQALYKEWYVISPTGKIVTRKATAETAAPPTSTAPTDTTDDGSKGGGYDYG